MPSYTTPRLGRDPNEGINCPSPRRHFFKMLFDKQVVKMRSRPRSGTGKSQMISLFWISGKTCWTECSKTCGGGTQVTCVNNTAVTRACNTIRCPGKRLVTMFVIYRFRPA